MLTRVDVATSGTNHVATLTNLASGTEYVYRVINRFNTNETLSDWRSFQTFKTGGAVTFNVIGDSGWGSSPQLVIADRMRESPADFLMHVGDLVYYAITKMNVDLRLFSVYREEMRSRPWFLAIGNHEAYVEPEVALQVLLPANELVTGTEHFYSFDHGDAHFTVAWSDMAVGARYEPGSPQHAWLDADLAASDKPWKFLFFHHTWRSSGIHRNDDYDFNAVIDAIQMDQAWPVWPASMECKSSLMAMIMIMSASLPAAVPSVSSAVAVEPNCILLVWHMLTACSSMRLITSFGSRFRTILRPSRQLGWMAMLLTASTSGVIFLNAIFNMLYGTAHPSRSAPRLTLTETSPARRLI